LRIRPRNEELWLALLTCLTLTGLYALLVYWTRKIPAAGSLFGHILGIIGFILMLSTEVLYSFRKRSKRARWGAMETWLKFHIFTGLVGPYLVLLHSSWKFNGLAGAVTLLTALIVLSGFVGRYIYTRIPRTLDPNDTVDPTKAAALAKYRRRMAIWHAIHIPIGMALFTAAFIHIGAALYYSTLLH
jgi:hypothetical protein